MLFVVLRTNQSLPMDTSTDNIKEQEKIARYAKALGHPTRIAILHFLAERNECFFGDIHEVLPIAKATVSQHLSELKEAGLIQGTIEPPKVRYCINQANWNEAKRLFAQMFAFGCDDNRKHCC